MKHILIALAGITIFLFISIYLCFAFVPSLIPRALHLVGQAYEFQKSEGINYMLNEKPLKTDLYHVKGKEYVILGPFPHLKRCKYLMVWDTDIFFFDDSPSVCVNNGKELILTVNIDDSDERFNLSDSMCGWDAKYIIGRSGDMLEYKVLPSTHFPDTLSFSIPQKYFGKQK